MSQLILNDIISRFIMFVNQNQSENPLADSATVPKPLSSDDLTHRPGLCSVLTDAARIYRLCASGSARVQGVVTRSGAFISRFCALLRCFVILRRIFSTPLHAFIPVRSRASPLPPWTHRRHDGRESGPKTLLSRSEAYPSPDADAFTIARTPRRVSTVFSFRRGVRYHGGPASGSMFRSANDRTNSCARR